MRSTSFQPLPYRELIENLTDAEHLQPTINSALWSWQDVDGIKKQGFLHHFPTVCRSRLSQPIGVLDVLQNDQLRILDHEYFAESLHIDGVAASIDAVADLRRIARLSPCLLEPVIEATPWEADRGGV